MSKLIILDRDGVLNVDQGQYITTPDEWVPIESSMEAVARLNESDYRVVIASNQAVVGKGIIDMGMLNQIHQKMNNTLSRYGGWIDAIFFCPDAPGAETDCRKPHPGMLLDIAKRSRRESLGDVPMVGDKLTDLQAAEAAGALPVLVRTGHGRQAEKDGHLPDGTRVYDDLAAFVTELLEP